MTTEPIRKIHSRAPTRIDLAGGTLDIWPLYLFLKKQPLTLNVAIDLFAEATLETDTSFEGFVLRSEDQKIEHKFSWDSLNSATPVPALELHFKLLKYFASGRPELRRTGLTLSTVAKSPAGAGLGGSSALTIAMIGSLATWARGRIDVPTEGERWIEVVRDVETTVIRVPAGLQDYYGAMFGGLQSLRWGIGSHQHEYLPRVIQQELEKRLLLFYSGQSRNSGINNWALYKSLIDQQGEIRERFDEITAAAGALEDALRLKDWVAVGTAIEKEWTTRRTLAPGITTPEIDKAFTIAKENGAASGKICGAGGGGCFFVYIPDGRDETREHLKEKISQTGVKHLPFHAVSQGLMVDES